MAPCILLHGFLELFDRGVFVKPRVCFGELRVESSDLLVCVVEIEAK